VLDHRLEEHIVRSGQEAVVLLEEFAAASALIDEAYAIAEATGSAPLRYPSMLLAAWRGNEAEALNVIDACIQDAKVRGLERTLGMSQCVTALLYNGLGRYQDALVAAQRARAYFPTDDLDDLGPPGWALIELVEAGARSGSREVASDALRQLAERTRASGTDWALGIEARSRALLSEGETADERGLYGMQPPIERILSGARRPNACGAGGKGGKSGLVPWPPGHRCSGAGRDSVPGAPRS
jgi:tetratricopeptide (TPR) repeat protein